MSDKTVKEVSDLLSIDPQAAYGMLVALVELGVLVKDGKVKNFTPDGKPARGKGSTLYKVADATKFAKVLDMFAIPVTRTNGIVLPDAEPLPPPPIVVEPEGIPEIPVEVAEIAPEDMTVDQLYSELEAAGVQAA